MVFPRHTQQWAIQELSAVRRLSVSLLWFGVCAGVVVRGYRWAAMSLLPTQTGGVLLGSIMVGLALLCGLATLHLANFTLRSWRWRAPALGALIGVGESAASLVLTVVGQERLGSTVAVLSDWPDVAVGVVLSRAVVVSLFALVLAAVVVVLRRAE
jgi:hypothetical protein